MDETRGLVVRAALDLPPLKKYQSQYFTFLTLGTPHLGLPYTSSIYGAGVTLLRKWRKSKALEQLQMSDAKDWRDTFLYNLARGRWPAAKTKGASKSILRLFDHVILVSSKQVRCVSVACDAPPLSGTLLNAFDLGQDKYAPYHSCRAEVCSASLKVTIPATPAPALAFPLGCFFVGRIREEALQLRKWLDHCGMEFAQSV